MAQWLIVSALDSGSSGPGSRPSRGHCVVFMSKTLHSRSASLTQVYKWVPANLMLAPAMGQHPIHGGVEIFLVASCYWNRDKLRPGEPLCSYADFTLHFTLNFWGNQFSTATISQGAEILFITSNGLPTSKLTEITVSLKRERYNRAETSRPINKLKRHEGRFVLFKREIKKRILLTFSFASILIARKTSAKAENLVIPFSSCLSNFWIDFYTTHEII